VSLGPVRLADKRPGKWGRTTDAILFGFVFSSGCIGHAASGKLLRLSRRPVVRPEHVERVLPGQPTQPRGANDGFQYGDADDQIIFRRRERRRKVIVEIRREQSRTKRVHGSTRFRVIKVISLTCSLSARNLELIPPPPIST